MRDAVRRCGRRSRRRQRLDAQRRGARGDCGRRAEVLRAATWSSAPGSSPSSSARRATNSRRPAARAPTCPARASHLHVRRSADSSSGSASSSRAARSIGFDGLDLTGQLLLPPRCARRTQAIALEVQPARPGFVAVVVEPGEQCRPRQSGSASVDAMLAQRISNAVHVGVGFEPKCAALPLDLLGPRESLQAEQRLAQIGVRELAVLVRPQQRGQFGRARPRCASARDRRAAGCAARSRGRPTCRRRRLSAHRTVSGQRSLQRPDEHASMPVTHGGRKLPTHPARGARPRRASVGRVVTKRARSPTADDGPQEPAATRRTTTGTRRRRRPWRSGQGRR